MKYNPLLISVLCTTAASIYSMQELNFKGTLKDLGRQQGERLASILSERKDTDMLDPVLEQLTQTLYYIKTFPYDSKLQFKGFVHGYAGGLVKFNLRSSQPNILLSATALQRKFAQQKIDQFDDAQKKSRKELIAFLTATFKKAKLLIQD